VAAAEFGIMAGADRVEGTLFGNGERTGNVDVVNLAMNLFTQGIDPELDLSDIDRLKGVAEFCNQLPVHPRHPWAGELVYTAFSGSHQDAIKKGMTALERSNSGLWEVPYLPVDPQDVGRDYEAIIRVNSQSGKGGVSYLLKANHGLDLPRNLQVEFSRLVQDVADQSGTEISSEDIWKLFESEYLREDGPYGFIEHWSVPDTHASERRKLTATIRRHGDELTIVGRGNGPIAAFVNALETDCGVKIAVKDYHEHALGRGADATAMAYVEVASESGDTLFGVGRHPNITNASLRAILCAVNRHLAGAG
jgi:2-isopropylmalate synthase